MDDEVIGKLLQDLSASNGERRAAAAELLARRAEPARDAAAALARACGDPNDEVRQWATAALEDLGPPAPAEIGPLIELAADESDDVCYWAVTLLGRAGADAADAVAALAGLLSDRESAEVRRRAAWALGHIGPLPGVTEALKRAATQDADRRVARAAQQALDELTGNRQTL